MLVLVSIFFNIVNPLFKVSSVDENEIALNSLYPEIKS